MEKLKKLLQNQWENVWFNAKMFFKSHDLSQIIQFSLLSLPFVLWIISLSCCEWFKILDILSLILSVFALIYFINYWKNQELFMEWGEKYMELYHEIETYYKGGNYSHEQIQVLKDKISVLNREKKPAYHIWAKKIVDKTMDKEMKYANEEKPWYK